MVCSPLHDAGTARKDCVVHDGRTGGMLPPPPLTHTRARAPPPFCKSPLSWGKSYTHRTWYIRRQDTHMHTHTYLLVCASWYLGILHAHAHAHAHVRICICCNHACACLTIVPSFDMCLLAGVWVYLVLHAHSSEKGRRPKRSRKPQDRLGHRDVPTHSACAVNTFPIRRQTWTLRPPAVLPRLLPYHAIPYCL